MIENKFVYFKTRKAFESERDSGHINYDSIVFVEEGRTIYTHGTEFGVSQVQSNITNLNQIIQDVSEELRKKIQDAIEQLQKENDKTGNDAQSGIDGIDKKIEDLKKQLDALDKSKGTKGEISLLDGRIQAYTDYINKQYQTITKWYQDINAELGKMVTNGELVDYVNDRYNKYMKEVDLKDAALREELSTGTTDGLVDTVVGRIMDADEGIFSNYVQKTTYNQDKEAIQEQIGRISAGAGTVTLEAIRNILDGDTEKTIAAKIFLDANGEGSTIKLDADRIDMTGAEETAVGRFIADLINAKEISTNTLHVEDSNHNTIDINNTDGIKGVTASDNSVGFHLKTDGSGELAKGNIKWNADGDLTIQNLTIEGSSFQSEKGHKLFRVDAICSNYSGVYIDYSIYSSGILLKSDRFYMSDSGYYNQLGIDGNESYSTTKLLYARNGHYVDPWDQPYETQSVYDEFSVPFIRFQPLYTNTPVITQWTTGTESDPEYHLKCERYMTITTFGFFTALAQRCFEYPVYNVDNVLTGHTKNPNHINRFKDRSGSVYWSYWDTSNRDLLNTEPIDISITADRAFVDVSWKEIFSIPDEDTTKYPDGRKWLIEDGENIEFWCVDHIIYGPYKSDTAGSNDNAILLSETYSTSEQRESAANQFILSSTRERSSDKAGENARYNNGYQERLVPFYGSTHIKFKRNPYDFYENAPAPVIPNPGTEEWNALMAYRNQDLSDAQIYDNDEAIAYKVWSLTVNESRFGWETW